MDLKLFKLQLIMHHFSSKAIIFKFFLVATVMAAIPCFNLILEIDPIDGCDPPWAKFPFRRVKMFETPQNLTQPPEAAPNARKVPDLESVFKDLMASDLMGRSDRVLCVGRRAARSVMVFRKLGFRNSIGVDSKACSSMVVKGDPNRLPFGANSFDFVFSGALDAVRVPARLVMEMERVLRPGRSGAVGMFASGPVPTVAVMKAAAPVSAFLRFSEVVGVRTVNSSVMVVFRKRVGIGEGAVRPPKQLQLPQQLLQYQ